MDACLLEWYDVIPLEVLKRIRTKGDRTIGQFVEGICPNFNTDDRFGSGNCNCTGCWSDGAISLKRMVDYETRALQNLCPLGFYSRYAMEPAERVVFERVFATKKCPDFFGLSKNRGHADSCETDNQFDGVKCWNPELEKIRRQVLARKGK